MTNRAILLGRLTKDPEVRTTPNGKVVATIVLAVDRPFKNENGNKETDFIPIVLWGKAGELVGQSCKKGHRLLVEGRIQIRQYEDRNGQKKFATEVIANSVEFIERKEKMEDMGQEVPW